MPEDLQDQINRYILDDGVSLSKVCSRINPLIVSRHIQVEPLSIRNISTHFRYHATADDRKAYAERIAGRPVVPEDAYEAFAQIAQVITDEQFSVEELNACIDQQRELFDKIMEDLSKRMASDSPPLTKAEVEPFAILSKEFRSTLKAIRESAKPREVVEAFVRTVQQQLVKSLAACHKKTLESMFDELVALVRDRKIQNEMRGVAERHLESSITNFKETSQMFDVTLAKIVATQREEV